jgi:hypothetical protein
MGFANPYADIPKALPQSRISDYVKWAMVALLVAGCLGPTFISYKPIVLSWDDSDYLARAVAASRALWSGDIHGLGSAVVSVHTPAMTFMGLHWGPMKSLDEIGRCFFALAALIAVLAAACLYMMLRIGVRPIFLVLASLCVAISLGPYITGLHSDDLYAMHTVATGFMADNLLAWVALAAVLLLPFEARTATASIKSAIVRGALAAAIFSLGVLTKISFFYFLALILPLLLFTRLRNHGIHNILTWLAAFSCCSTPAAVYLLRYGRSAFANAQAASFGGLAVLYHVPVWHFLGGVLRESPGFALELLLLAVASGFVVLKKRPEWSDTRFLAFLITLGFLGVVLASPSKLSRYLFPAIVALPFLLAILVSEKKDAIPVSRAGVAAGLLLTILVAAAMPTMHREYRESLKRAELVLAQAEQLNAKSIVLATDSPTLNAPLLRLALEFSPYKPSVGTLAYEAMSQVPIKNDFHAISLADVVVFQDSQHINPKFTNQRVTEYEAYLRQTGVVPVRTSSDLYLYCPSRDPLAGKSGCLAGGFSLGGF